MITFHARLEFAHQPENFRNQLGKVMRHNKYIILLKHLAYTTMGDKYAMPI